MSQAEDFESIDGADRKPTLADLIASWLRATDDHRRAVEAVGAAVATKNEAHGRECDAREALTERLRDAGDGQAATIEIGGKLWAVWREYSSLRCLRLADPIRVQAPTGPPEY
jgi:hypothetical protein